MAVVFDFISYHVSNGLFESYMLDNGEVEEHFNGVAVRDGCFCKHYKKAMNWKTEEKERNPDTGYPYLEHYCSLNGRFMGFCYCCDPNSDCFEIGKPVSKEVVTLSRKIKEKRIGEGKILE